MSGAVEARRRCSCPRSGTISTTNAPAGRVVERDGEATDERDGVDRGAAAGRRMNASAASANDCSIAIDCTMSSSSRLSDRSATRPAHGPRNSSGPNWAAASRPRATPLSVRLQHQQGLGDHRQPVADLGDRAGRRRTAGSCGCAASGTSPRRGASGAPAHAASVAPGAAWRPAAARRRRRSPGCGSGCGTGGRGSGAGRRRRGRARPASSAPRPAGVSTASITRRSSVEGSRATRPCFDQAVEAAGEPDGERCRPTGEVAHAQALVGRLGEVAPARRSRRSLMPCRSRSSASSDALTSS